MTNKLIFILLVFTKLSCANKSNKSPLSNDKINPISKDSLPIQLIKKMNFAKLENAFSDSLIVKQYYLDNDKKIDYTLTFKKHTIGKIKITSGQIIACDGIVNYGSEPFKQDFPKGEFTIDLAVGKYNFNNDERVGFSRIRFSENIPICWEIAVHKGQDIKQLKEDEIFGYGVDSGTGSFMDTNGKRELDLFLDPRNRTIYDSNFEIILKELQKSDTPTWSHYIWEKNGQNVVFFSSGVGDGFYATYIGYDSKNQICRLVTDFDLIMN